MFFLGEKDGGLAGSVMGFDILLQLGQHAFGLHESKIVLLAVDAVWCFWLISTMDLEEFAWLKPYVQLAIPVLFFLTVIFVDELLAARALGIFAMLIAEPMISSAFLRPELWRLLIVVLAYVWLTLGMFWVGKPYLLRDQITWVTKSILRWRVATALGVAWGALILGFALKG